MAISHLRINYDVGKLLEESCPKDPFVLFDYWFKEATKTEVEPNGMNLATSTKSGRPTTRIVLLKEYSNNSFIFYTNYESKKGQDLLDNPYCACSFWWGQRQVRIEGKAHKVSAETSDKYYLSRPRGSQLGAWSSKQSTSIGSREELELIEQNVIQRFEGKELKRPLFWGGFEIVPESIEFWQGRPSRLHDRILYELKGHEWSMKRLCP
jgi:pyridoxamine 5'-phosphate oxidase